MTLSEHDSKLCSACQEWRPLSAFHRRGNGLQTWCKSCRRAHDASYYLARRDLRATQKRERSDGLRAWMREYKASRGGRFHPAAMTFEHLPGTTKRTDVSTLLHSGYRKVLLDEIAKCELVCANCHAVRTSMRSQGTGNTQMAEAAARYVVRAA